MINTQLIAYKLFQFSFRLVTILFPKKSDQWAINLFLTPIRAPYTKKGIEMIEQCEEISITVNERTLVGYTIGSGPTVICMHGWAGKTTQFAHLAKALSKNGYRFIGFDAWAHGANPGNRASLFDFRDLVMAILNEFQSVHCVIGHSLGAASVSLAASEGCTIPKFVSLGAPVVGEDILDVFIHRINGRPQHKSALRQACQDMFDLEFDDVTMQHTFKSLSNTPTLGIHGTKDVDADVSHLDILKQLNPNMTTYKAEGLGHRRILKDETVINIILDFLKNDS